MGVIAARSRARATPQTWPGAVLVPAGMLFSVAAAIAVAALLIVFAWREAAFVLTAPSPQGVAGALARTLELLALSLPLTLIAGFFAAAALWDVRIGGRVARPFAAALRVGAGMPPIVVGAALWLAFKLLGLPFSVWSAALALVLLNAPRLSAWALHTVQLAPQALQEAAAAAGADPAFILFGVVLPALRREVWAIVARTAAQIAGQAAVLVLVFPTSAGSEPLALQIWHFASNPSLLGVTAAQSLALVVLVAAFAVIAEVVSSHPGYRRPEL